LTAAELGQSTVVSLGDESPVGTLFTPVVEAFEADPQTESIVLFGHGGSGDEEAVARRVIGGDFKKPIVALLTGDAIEPMSVAQKRSALRDAGVQVVGAIAEIAPALERLVAEDRLAAHV
jgi:succinyl-CoA synthetase alpha subunit